MYLVNLGGPVLDNIHVKECSNLPLCLTLRLVLCLMLNLLLCLLTNLPCLKVNLALSLYEPGSVPDIDTHFMANPLLDMADDAGNMSGVHLPSEI